MLRHNYMLVRSDLVVTLVLFGLLFISSTSLVSAHYQLPSGVEVSISAVKTTIDVDDALLIEVSYRNVSTQEVRLLKWNTALGGGVTEDLFLVQYQGMQMRYTGLHAKRLPPIDDDYVVLAPGQTASKTVDILSSYPIDYQGEYDVSLHDNGVIRQKTAASLTISLTADREVIATKQPAIFQNCSSTQISQINPALTSAERIANVAANDLRNAPVDQRPSAARYLEWFGAFNTARYATVQRNMDRIASALSNQRIGFNCDCSGVAGIDPSRTFAFVFTNDPFNMTLCDVFFRVPREGTDSMSGTIVHEVSHFNVVAATDDFRPNQAGIRALADSDPASAIRAANAYEYFAENTPFLSMPRPADLTVSSFTISEREPIEGQPVTAQATITNQGDGISTSTTIRLELLDALNDSQVIEGALGAVVGGSNRGFQLTFAAPSEPGDYRAQLCIVSPPGEIVVANNCSIFVSFIVQESQSNASFIGGLLLLLLGQD